VSLEVGKEARNGDGKRRSGGDWRDNKALMTAVVRPVPGITISLHQQNCNE